MVEIKGSNRLFPACMTYPTRHGNHHQLRAAEGVSQTGVELLFSERNHVCAVCVSNGSCELQALAYDLGMSHVGVPYLNPNLPVDASHAYFGLDHNRCILCTRCVRVCDEMEGAAHLGRDGPRRRKPASADLNQPWGDSLSCTSCGKCVQVCPTGALFEKGKSVAEMRKKHEFLPYLRLMREGAMEVRMTNNHGHRLAGRLFRLPHVVS
jgi:bidirectional [NiFe] hydrogenase diaphorase subunit